MLAVEKMSEHKQDLPAYPTLPPGYSILKKLGQGGYGSVFSCREISTGRELAVKQIESNERGISAVMEADIMASISHPHLVKAEKIIADGRNLFLFQEKAKCDLGHLVRKKQQPPPPHLLRQWTFALAQAVACLHQQGIVHADIKASNILLFDYETNGVPTIKLADFNLAQKVWKTLEFGDAISTLNFRACTCTHRPLEVWLGHDWDFSVDIWALGCTLFEVAYGSYIFPYQGWEDDVPKHLLKDRFIACLDDFAKKGPDGPQKVPFNYKRSNTSYLSFQIPSSFNNPDYALFNQLILSMLRFDPAERPKITTILEHPYFHGLTRIPYQTITASEEELPPKKEQKYIEQLKKLTTQAIIIDVSLSLIRKIQHLRFRYPNFEDDRLRLIGAYWLASKLILRRTPSLPYPQSVLHRIERRICEYLSYCLIV